MQSIEKAIQYLEYGISLFRWCVDSLRNFPIWKNESKKTDSDL